MAFNTEGDEPPCTIHFSLNCSPAGNASISGTNIYTDTGEATIYVSATGHCTCSVSAWASDEKDGTPTSTTSSFTFVSGHWNPVTVNGVTSDGPPTIVSGNCTGSGSLCLLGQYHYGFNGPSASYNINGLTDLSTIIGADRGYSYAFTDYTSIDALAQTLGYMDNTENATSAGSAFCRWASTWGPDASSGSETPLGYYLRVTCVQNALAVHDESAGTANGTSGSGSSPVTVSASGEGRVIDDKWNLPTSTITVDHPVTASYQEAYVNLSASAHAISAADSGIYDDWGSTECVNSAGIELLHQHINAN
jgi:hypothetical protein